MRVLIMTKIFPNRLEPLSSPFNREQFAAHYHKRSNVESTFSMIKAKFRDHVRSKTDVAMKNEVLCKVLCHNICCVIGAMHELGIEAAF